MVILAGTLPLVAAAPPVNPSFEDGARAFRFRQWEEAARKMREAHDYLPEDGRSLTSHYDRWKGPYLPLVYLGASLAEWGCHAQARDWLARSELCKRIPSGAKKARAWCDELVASAEQRLRKTPVNGPPPDKCAEFAPGQGTPR